MRPRPSRFLEGLGGLALAAALAPALASAQPCCVGTGLLTPARLAEHESALVAVQARAGDVLASFDGTGHLLSTSGAAEQDFEQDVLGSVRFLQRGQLSLTVPMIETRRASSGFAEAGGGVGDIGLSARWDLIVDREGGTHLPGIAVLGGVTAPTGRAPESATLPLGSDATGLGAWQGAVGIAAEQTGRHVFVMGTLMLTDRSTRHVAGLTETLGLQFSGGLAVGWAFDSGPVLGVTATYLAAPDAIIDGQPVAGSGRTQTLVGVAAARPIGADWRLQGTLSGQVPIAGLGRNEPVSWGLSALLIRGWM